MSNKGKGEQINTGFKLRNSLRRRIDLHSDPSLEAVMCNYFFGSDVFRRWNGTQWIIARLERWDVSAWVDSRLKHWNGTNWISVTINKN